jgi:hypothetical protein
MKRESERIVLVGVFDAGDKMYGGWIVVIDFVRIVPIELLENCDGKGLYRKSKVIWRRYGLRKVESYDDGDIIYRE